MKRAIRTTLLLFAVSAAGVAAALTVSLTGPSTYADEQWRSICISNKNGGTVFTGVIEVCPSTSDPAAPGSCSVSTRSVATLPSNYQTFVNTFIAFWRTDHPGF